MTKTSGTAGPLTSIEAAKVAAKALYEKKAEEMLLLDVHELTSLTEYMLLVTATSQPHIRSLCEEVEIAMEAAGEIKLHREGYRSDNWVVLDYGVVLVHVFTREQRSFYDLEHLWADAPRVDLKSLLQDTKFDTEEEKAAAE